jgi:hypothetical protein
MSNIYGLIIAAPSTAKTFCKEGNSGFLRGMRARYGMTEPKDENLRLGKMSGCVVVGIATLEPIPLRVLLRIVRNESYRAFPHPPNTYAQEKHLFEQLAKEIPFFFGTRDSVAPWLWQIPAEVVEHLAQIESKRELSKLATLWEKAFDSDPLKDWHSDQCSKDTLEALQTASKEAVRSKKKVFLYCST